MQLKTPYLQHNKHNMHVFEQLLSAVAPHRCIACGLEGAPLCRPCYQQLPDPPKCCYKCGKTARQGICADCQEHSSLQSITVRTLYEGIAERAVHRLKFERNRSMAAALAYSTADLCPTGVVTHVPTANRRARQRGYDQAQLIARLVAEASGNPHQTLLRRYGSQRQLGQSRAIRQQQLSDAFCSVFRVADKRTPVIIVDDVLTTGATFEAAAKVLHQAGYETIHALAFAWAAVQN